MSRQQLIGIIRRELEVINEIIDRKILRGISYRQEALRHKQLCLKLKRL